MSIFQAIMLALMPSMTVFAILLCRPAFRRQEGIRQADPHRRDVSKDGVYGYPGFAAIALAKRSDPAKGGKGRSSIRRH